MNFSRNEVVLLPIPFSDLSSVGVLSSTEAAELQTRLRAWLEL